MLSCCSEGKVALYLDFVFVCFLLCTVVTAGTIPKRFTMARAIHKQHPYTTPKQFEAVLYAVPVG